MKLIIAIAQLSAAKILLIALFLTAGYFFMYYDDGKKLSQNIVSLNSQIKTEEVKKKETEAIIKKEDEMQANLAALARDLQVVKAKIPNDLNDTEMNGLINRAAAISGISITALSRKAAVVNEAKAVGSESVEEVVFSVTIQGAFNRLVKFVEHLANDEKIIKIRNFSIERNRTALATPQITFYGEVIGFKQARVPK